MRNLIGHVPPRGPLLGLEGLHLHDYGKTPRVRRKVGHCTLVDQDRASAMERLAALESLLGTLE